MIVFDANVLITLVSTKANRDDLARLEDLIADMSKRRSYVGIPTPSLAEFLVKSDGATQAVLATIEHKSSVRVLPFDKKAAYECSLLDRKALANGNKRGPSKGSVPYQKIKVDRQIIAIAISNNAEMIVSGDDNLIALAKDVGLKAIRIEELPLPPAALQCPLEFGVYQSSLPAGRSLPSAVPALSAPANPSTTKPDEEAPTID